jgi:acyl-CoA synthetase (NDP forming)
VLFRDGRWPRPGGVALVSSSGGRCSLLGDLANGTALPLATFAPATLARLGELLPEFGTPNNPLDPTGVVFDRAGVFAPALEAIGNDPGVGLVGVFQVTRSINAPATAPAIAVERGTDQGSAGPRTHRSVGLAGEVVEAAQGSAAPVVAFTSATGGVVDPQVVEVLATGHVPLLRGLESALGAMGALVEAAAFRQQPVTEPAVLPAAARTAPARQALAVASGRLREAGALSEAETKALLQAYGVRTPGGHAVDTLDEALAAATEQGYPIVLKTSQPGLAHKSDHALVWLDVQTEAGVRAAFEALRPHGSGVLVEPQVPAGLELILGGRSTEFGPIVLCGAGGILAELVQDTALALAPLASRESAAALLDRTRVARLLDGFRGTPRDRTAVLDALLAVSWLVADLAATDLAFDLDVNPLVVDTRGAVVVDALLRAT